MSAKTTSKTTKKQKNEEVIKKTSGVAAVKEVDVKDKVDEPIEPAEDVFYVEGGEGTIKGEDKGNKKEKYYQAVGRRKESVAIVRLYTKKSTDIIEGDSALVIVNGKDYRDYFSDKILQAVLESPLRKLKSANRFKATVKVVGGGLSGQADAIKAGLSRTLVLFDINFRKKLKKAGFLTRDSRVKERRKYGLKKARKSPSWSKR